MYSRPLSEKKHRRGATSHRLGMESSVDFDGKLGKRPSSPEVHLARGFQYPSCVTLAVCSIFPMDPFLLISFFQVVCIF